MTGILHMKVIAQIVLQGSNTMQIILKYHNIIHNYYQDNTTH